jgi:phosphoadenosine phosphosulfate reductase
MRGLASGAPSAHEDLEGASAEEVLAHMLERHHPRVALACSFQKEEAVLIDMLVRLDPAARIFTIDTGALFPETYRAWREIERHYGVRVECFDAVPARGDAWASGRCCSEAKVAALDRALSGLDGWITGLRREQAPTRGATPKLRYDERRDVWKANPLADWDARAVWDYIASHDVPYNALHDRGYDSIGCMPCTLPGAGREGRWAGSDKTECGIHV